MTWLIIHACSIDSNHLVAKTILNQLDRRRFLLPNSLSLDYPMYTVHELLTTYINQE
jgi:hypothetical protein